MEASEAVEVVSLFVRTAGCNPVAIIIMIIITITSITISRSRSITINSITIMICTMIAIMIIMIINMRLVSLFERTAGRNPVRFHQKAPFFTIKVLLYHPSQTQTQPDNKEKSYFRFREKNENDY